MSLNWFADPNHMTVAIVLVGILAVAVIVWATRHDRPKRPKS